MQGNELTLIGNLTRDPELRVTAGGLTVVNFGIAWNRRFQRDGEWQDEAHFFNVVAFGDLGDNVHTSLHQGDRVVISGRIDFNSWEDDKGEKRSVVRIIADDVAPSLRWATAAVHKVQKGAPKAAAPATQTWADGEDPF